MTDPLPYGRQSIDDSDADAVLQVLHSDWLTTGPAVSVFEADLSAWAGGAATVAVSSGTAALHVAYAAAGVGAGDTVITTPMSFVATAATAAILGAKIVFADVEADTANLDPAAVESALTAETRVVTAVDYAGHPAALDELGALARRSGTVLIEDAAHSLGGTWQGRLVGSLADLTTFSFFPTKNVTTAEGGAVAATREDLHTKAKRYRNHGLLREPSALRDPDVGGWHQEVHEFGLNYRLPDVLCALGSSQLRRLGEFKARRAAIKQRYDAGLAQCAVVAGPPCRPGADPVWHLYPLRVRDGQRRALYEHLRGSGINAQVNYLPIYWHPVFQDLGYRRGLCPNAERFYAEQLSLPMYPGLRNSDVDRVIDAILEFFG